MSKSLVIVESKTKADTIGRFLGDDFTVLASFGHVRDLPRKGLGVDVDDHFRLEYAPPEGRAKEVVSTLRRALKGADELFLATDEDREGEAIALAPHRGARSQDAREADGVPRDHTRGDRRRHREPA